MARGVTKKDLIAEMAVSAKVNKAQCSRLLDALAAIACREASGAGGFTVPGICRLKVVTRGARSFRHFRTGKRMWIGEHQAVKITPLKKAKDAIVDTTPDVIVEEEPGAVPAGMKLFTFRCPSCREEIEASSDMVGVQTPCPACGVQLAVPSEAEAQAAGYTTLACPGCRAEIEAPIEMAGMKTPCPGCGRELTIPTISTGATAKPAAPMIPQGTGDQSSRTIRIELPEQLAPSPTKAAPRKIIIRRSASGFAPK